MARGQNNRGGNSSSGNSNSNSQRGRSNNNPEGRNQYSSGVMDMARERPITAAITAAATVGAGVFLWSRRNQISDQLSNLSDQIGEWTENMNFGGGSASFDDDTAGLASGSRSQFGTSGSGGSSAGRGPASSGGRSQTEIAEEALSLKETGASANTRNQSTTA